MTDDQALELKIVAADLRHLYMNLAVRQDSVEKKHDQGLVSRCIKKLESLLQDEIPGPKPTTPDRPSLIKGG